MTGRETDPDQDFTIELQRMEFEDDDPFGPETYVITFRVERDGRGFDVNVWLLAHSVPTVDLIRAAMVLLHEVVAKLTEQTRAWKGGTA
ncbi:MULTISPECIES: hypothetical protein [Methylobacterium]|uniref:hypothetical protein n=1 Tax=Methylobacterium TaxID=407 RepID=UPI0013EE266F|nr:hypothetical protein [Methylobacterium sp. DB0501]NGM33854.1 hypothetical protein [Methylobacterium sp. DB0501]